MFINCFVIKTVSLTGCFELSCQPHTCRYSRDNTFRKMDDCLFVAAMGPPGGGRNLITSRYGRHFNHISIVDFDDATLKRIFSTILGWHLGKETFQPDIQVSKTHVRYV